MSSNINLVNFLNRLQMKMLHKSGSWNDPFGMSDFTLYHLLNDEFYFYLMFSVFKLTVYEFQRVKTIQKRICDSLAFSTIVQWMISLSKVF